MSQESEQLNFIIGLLIGIFFFVAGGRAEHLFQSLFHAALWFVAAWAAFCGIRWIVRGIAKASVALGIPKAAATLFAASGWLIAAFCVAIPVGCIVAGLVLDIEWLWFWPSVLVAIVAYPFLGALANELPYLRKDQ